MNSMIFMSKVEGYLLYSRRSLLYISHYCCFSITKAKILLATNSYCVNIFNSRKMWRLWQYHQVLSNNIILANLLCKAANKVFYCPSFVLYDITSTIITYSSTIIHDWILILLMYTNTQGKRLQPHT